MASGIKPPELDERSIKFQGLLVFLAGLAIYFNSIFNQFAFDDISIIVNNRIFSGELKIINALKMDFWAISKDYPVTIHSGLFRPIVTLSYVFNHWIHGIQPWGFHFFNICIHAFNGVLVFKLFHKLIKSNNRIALIVALLYILHPIHTEAVANVSGRAELLFTFFYLSAWLLHIKQLWDPGPSARWRPIAIMLLLLCSLLSKESSISFLGLIIIGDIFYKYDNGIKFNNTNYIKLYILYALFFILFVLIRHQFVPLGLQGSVMPLENFLITMSTPLRIINALYIALIEYPFLLLFPFNLSPDYSFNSIRLINKLLCPQVAMLFMIIVAIVVVLIIFIRTKNIFTLGVLFYLVSIFPTSNILMPIGTIMAERLLYLPSLGFCLALGWLVDQGLGRQKTRAVAMASLLLISAGYSIRTYTRNAHWFDNMTIFTKGLTVSNDNAKLHYSLAKEYLYNGNNSSAALQHLNKAIAIMPDHEFFYLSRAQIFGQKNQHAAAIKDLEFFLERSPAQVNAVKQLAYSYFCVGDIARATAVYERLVQNKQAYPDEFFNLGLIYLHQDQLSRALKLWNLGLSRFPGNQNLQAAIAEHRGDRTALPK